MVADQPGAGQLCTDCLKDASGVSIGSLLPIFHQAIEVSVGSLLPFFHEFLVASVLTTSNTQLMGQVSSQRGQIESVDQDRRLGGGEIAFKLGRTKVKEIVHPVQVLLGLSSRGYVEVLASLIQFDCFGFLVVKPVHVVVLVYSSSKCFLVRSD